VHLLDGHGDLLLPKVLLTKLESYSDSISHFIWLAP
jgi:hypothetical protein